MRSKASYLRPVQRYLVYAKPYWKVFAGFILATLVLNLASVAQPYLLKLLTDKVLKEKNLQWLHLVLFGILGTALLKGIFTFVQGYLMAFAGQGAMKRLRNDLYEHLQFLPLSFFDKGRIGDIMTRLTTDVMNMTQVCTTGAISLLNDFFVLTCSLAWMMYKDWRMTCLALIVSPFIAYLISQFGRKIESAAISAQAKISDLASFVQEVLSGIKVVKSYTREKYEASRFAETNEENFKISMRVMQLTITKRPVVEVLATIGIGIVIWYGSLGVIHGKFTLGDIMAFWGYMLMATTPLNRASVTLATFFTGMASARRVFEILDFPVEVKVAAQGKELPPLQGTVEFQDVHFSYEKDHEVLKGVSFQVQPGERVAIVGRNGSGKTTILNLLARFYDVNQGKVLMDGVDIRELPLHSLRKQLGIVLQETIIFSGTVRENIAYGKLEEATDEEVYEAAKFANAHEFILSLPHQYATTIGERGVGLSGGQRQRIAIARAVLRNPRIVMLDEATSSLDQESEGVVQDALEKLMAGRTTFIVAHRLSSARRADQVVVMDGGRIAEQGTHDQLMSQKGLYWRLYSAQIQEEEAAV